jgi:ParB family chromosome partitioning protein
MKIEMIPLNKPVPSSANVRKTGTGIRIDELAASISAHGLLQNLQVRATPRGTFEVIAGGRRYAALKLLAKQKSMAKDEPIGCNVLQDGEDATEISLAENVIRVDMHPADEFEAFKRLADAGKPPEDIAARYGVSALVVRQRLELAAVSPVLMGIYRAGQMTLEHLMTFTVSDDHTAQEAAWHELPKWQRNPRAIRKHLTHA